MIEVRKKDKETTESLMRRFSRRIQQSGVLVRARKTRFKNDEKSKTEKRQEALYKVKIRKEINALKKLGKFDDEALKKKKTDAETAAAKETDAVKKAQECGQIPLA